MEASEWRETHKWLLRLLKGRGKLQGHFYYAGPASAAAPLEQQGLLVTAVGKDPTGAKVLQRGRALRQSLRDSVKKTIGFARGSVYADPDKVLHFVVEDGTLGARRLHKSIKKWGRVKPHGLNLAFLIRAVVRDGQEEVQLTGPLTAEEDQALAESLAAAAAVPEDEVAALLADQDRFLAMNDTLIAALGTPDEPASPSLERALASIGSSQSKLHQALVAKDETRALAAAEALFEARSALASATAHLGSPFAATGPLPAAFVASLEDAADTLRTQVTSRLDQLLAEMEAGPASLARWERARREIDGWLSTYSDVLD